MLDVVGAVDETDESFESALNDESTRVTSSGPVATPTQIPTAELMALMSDRYRIVRRIGKGGMGEVFLAEHTAIGKQVAIKILGEEFAKKQRIVQRFLQEARAASLIRHENVVDITDFGHTPSGLPFLTMEFLVGEDLKHMLRREVRLPWPRARRILVQLLAGLGAAHRQGVIHRDIKPDNCFRVQRGENSDFIKVLDFGIAKVIGEEVDQNLTQTGVVMGTAEYMSPEQARSDELDARTDLYAVGVILFEMLTGQVPFRANGFMGTLSKHIMEPPPSPRALAPEAGISRALELVVLKALAKDPADRFQSAEEFSAALRALPPARDDEVAPVQRPRWLIGAAALLLVGSGATWGALGLLGTSLSETPGPVAAAVDPPSAPVDPPDPAGPPTAESVVSPVEPLVTPPVEPPVVAPDPTPAPKGDPAKKREGKPRAEAKLPDKLTPEQLRAGFAAVDAAARDCRSKHGGVPGTVVYVQMTVTTDGKVQGASARKPYQGTSLGRCVEAAASKASFPKASAGQRAEPGFKL